MHDPATRQLAFIGNRTARLAKHQLFTTLLKTIPSIYFFCNAPLSASSKYFRCKGEKKFCQQTGKKGKNKMSFKRREISTVVGKIENIAYQIVKKRWFVYLKC